MSLESVPKKNEPVQLSKVKIKDILQLVQYEMIHDTIFFEDIYSGIPRLS